MLLHALLLLLTVLSPNALAWKTGEQADIKLDQQIDVDGKALFDHLGDFENWEALFPEDCVTEWIHGSETSGPNARSRVTYQMASMKRRLTVTFAKNEVREQETLVKDGTGQVVETRTEVIGWIIDADHEGKKGFVTRWRIDAPAEGAKTRVRLETFMNPPPWPFRKYYFKKVKPAWTDCYERAMSGIPEAVGS